MSRYLLHCALALFASLLAACSSFDRHWKDAARGKSPATRWDGYWRSGKNVYTTGGYHHGRLRCVLEEQPASKSLAGDRAARKPQNLTAYFHANWLDFSANYTMTLEPVSSGSKLGGVRKYQGTHDLPAIFGGTYHYQATIAGDHLTADYSCSIDRGIFDLRRVPPGKENPDLHAQH